MKHASRFLTPPDPVETVTLIVDGMSISARKGETLAAALLANSGAAFRTTGTGQPRTAYCMMGVCFECLIEVNGLPNAQACMMEVEDGMIVKRQQGLRSLQGGTDG